jgi:hypothetical protein
MSNTAYIPVDVDTTATDLAAEAFGYIENQVPGWLPSPGNLEAWLIEALAQIAAELRTLVAQVPDSIFGYFGSTIMGLPPYPAAPATAVTSWTAIDNKGYTVNAGTVIAITPAGSTASYTFAVATTFTIAAGQTVVHGVQCTALQPGAAASGITGSVQVIDALDFISGVTLDQATSGGQDAEASDAYRSRLSALLLTMAPRPILPNDFAILAQRQVEGVDRATAIDLYNPGPPVNANDPRCVTVAVCDNAGNPCSAAVKTEVDNLLQSEREVNFLVFVVDPTYTTIDVTTTVVCFPGYQPASVQTAVANALNNYLLPATWGIPPYGDTSGLSWINATVVRYLEVSAEINRVPGVDYVSALAIAVHGSALGQADVPLAGVAPMPKPGTITVTANPAPA